VTGYKLNRFAMSDAEALVGKVADITEWYQDEMERKITYPAARVTGIVTRGGPMLVIETSCDGVISDACTGARAGLWHPDGPQTMVWFTWICEVNVRDQ
jgi:hypothetical protein